MTHGSSYQPMGNAVTYDLTLNNSSVYVMHLVITIDMVIYRYTVHVGVCDMCAYRASTKRFETGSAVRLHSLATSVRCHMLRV